MDAMQYKIILPDDYDMSLIRKRVEENGTKTDNFQGLLFKAYLISEKVQGAISNSYSPLYIWENSDGMNQFIFAGFYDNVLQDFGWQLIQIGIPLTVELKESFSDATYLLEQTITIPEQHSLVDIPNKLLKIQETLPTNSVGKLIVYNPDKWQAVVFGFYAEKPFRSESALYEILHVSTKLKI